MSSEKSHIPSNEEIVNELTADLEKTLKPDPSAPNTNDGSHSLDEESFRQKSPVDQNCSEDFSKDSAGQADDVHEDEEFRKEMEEKLTDEEKEERREESQSLKKDGNDKYNEESYEGAIKKYTQALLICPSCFSKERSIMYSNRAACHMKLERQEIAIKDCTQAINLNPCYVKAILRRAQLYESTDKLDEALTDFKKILELEPKNVEANRACLELPPKINERNEKLKQEMMGKLKDLGNLFLRPFGLSTNNFQLNQDPNSGGYSVQFQGNGDPRKTT